MDTLQQSELILNDDGSIYHLHLKPENISDTIIIVGDPGRVSKVSSCFDKIEFKISNREITTHTGYFNGKRLSVLSTGMGTDNLDIVINELDALVNIDLEKKERKKEHTSLNIIRLGTSGALQSDIPVNSFVASEYVIGLDGIMNFYQCNRDIFYDDITNAFIEQTLWDEKLPFPYTLKASSDLYAKVAYDMIAGFTATAPGFYGPQGRILRLPLAYPQLNKNIEDFSYKNLKISNFEMETSALYGIGQMLGHSTLTVCVIIANRVTKEFSKNYHPHVAKLIQILLEKITS